VRPNRAATVRERSALVFTHKPRTSPARQSVCENAPVTVVLPSLTLRVLFAPIRSARAEGIFEFSHRLFRAGFIPGERLNKK
jgi:hypothetical protein